MSFPSLGLHLQVRLPFPDLFGLKSLHRDLIQTHHRLLESFACALHTQALPVQPSGCRGSSGSLCHSFLFPLSYSEVVFSSTARSCLAWKGNPRFRWSWLTLHFHCLNACTFLDRTTDLIVRLDCNKPSFSTDSHECHIFLSFLAHSGLQQFDSYLHFSQCKTAADYMMLFHCWVMKKRHRDQKRYWNFCYSCHYWACCRVASSYPDLLSQKQKLWFLSSLHEYGGLFILFLVWSRALNGSTQSYYKALRESY